MMKKWNKIKIKLENNEVNFRRESLEGRSHLVCPAVMLVEGVHNGSFSSVYYPRECLSKNVGDWNHKPVLVYHPLEYAEGFGCSPEIINKQKVGVLFNTKFEDSTTKLKTEVWIDVSRAEQVDYRIMNRINKKEPMEVSTGLMFEGEEKVGTWNGENYYFVANTLHPDHLALLPDVKGACSLKDGAGLLVNSSKDNVTTQPIPYFHFKFEKNRKLPFVAMLHEQFDSNATIIVEDVFSDRIVFSEIQNENRKVFVQRIKIDNQDIPKLIGNKSETSRFRSLSFVPALTKKALNSTMPLTKKDIQ